MALKFEKETKIYKTLKVINEDEKPICFVTNNVRNGAAIEISWAASEREFIFSGQKRIIIDKENAEYLIQILLEMVKE